MSTTVERGGLPYEVQDAALLRLISEYRLHGDHSQAASTLFREFLPSLTQRLRYEFPKAEEEDIMSRAWEATRKVGLEMATSPSAYLMECVRVSLRRKTTADRHGVSENLVRSALWKKLKAEINLQVGERFVHPMGDEDRAFLQQKPRKSSFVWDDLTCVLIEKGWPVLVANEAVSIIQSHAEEHTMHKVAESKALAKLLPPPLQDALISFVNCRWGYIWARLHGISDTSARDRPRVKEQLPKLTYSQHTTFQ